MTNDNLMWLSEWYDKYCDGGWEHGNGIKIGTIDNPGWNLKISLDETEIQNQNFKIIDIDRLATDWIYCKVENNVFEGFGGPFNLPQLIQIFRNWVENCQNKSVS